MTPEEQRAYGKGYAAGTRRKHREDIAHRFAAQREAFRLRAFLAALPFTMSQRDWRHGEKPINTIAERVSLARDVADEAVKQLL